MPSMSSAAARRNMIDCQLLPNKVTDQAVLSAMAAMPRESFVPANLGAVAYLDKELPIAPGRALLEPMVLARLLQAAEISAGEKILVVACGSGYEAAIAAHVGAVVVAVDHASTLLDQAKAAAAQAGGAQPKFVAAAPAEGAAGDGPYDVVLVCGGYERLPDSLLAQLKPEGRLIGVAKRQGVGRAQILRQFDGRWIARDLFDAAVSLYPEFKAPSGFVF